MQRLTDLQKQKNSFQERMNDLTKSIKRRMDSKSQNISNEYVNVRTQKIIDPNDDEFEIEYTRVVDNEEILEQDEVSKEQEKELGVEDPYLGMEVYLPKSGNDNMRGKVKMRVVDDVGTAVGVPNNNPLLHTRKYHVDFLDGSKDVYSANNFTENILSQVDEEEHRGMMLDKIVGFRKDKNTIPKSREAFSRRMER